MSQSYLYDEILAWSIYVGSQNSDKVKLTMFHLLVRKAMWMRLLFLLALLGHTRM